LNKAREHAEFMAGHISGYATRNLEPEVPADGDEAGAGGEVARRPPVPSPAPKHPHGGIMSPNLNDANPEETQGVVKRGKRNMWSVPVY
jgi:hypothetical protein